MSVERVHVAFAGHNRPRDLGDRDEVAQALARAFDLVGGLQVEAILLTGLADGADHIAAQAWKARALGAIHAVYPFLEDRPDPAIAGLAATATWLDGHALEAEGRNPHLTQARWLVEAADLLVVVWTGGRARGAGGTADAVRLALEQGVPVVWVKPGDAVHLRLISPEHLDDDSGFLEFLEQLETDRAPLITAATPESLARSLSALNAAPQSVTAPASPGWLDRLLRRTLWTTYDIFTRMVGGHAASAPPPSPPPDDLAAQPGFVILSQAREAADREAGRLAAVHRSQQLLLLVIAIAAAVVGSSPAVWPGLKIYAVLTELVLALGALAISYGSARVGRHERWGQARRLAEQLRLERAGWALGLSALADRANARDGSSGEVAWSMRRRAGLASGAYDADRVAGWGGWVMEELVEGQARYHRDRGAANAHIAHRIHRFEAFSFAIFVVALGGFAIAYFVAKSQGLYLPPKLAGAVVMVGVIVPALAAASIALEATLAFAEQARRNRVLAERLGAIGASLGPKTGPGPGLAQLQQAARAAIRLEVSQEDRWTEDAFRRRLVRAG